VIRETREIDGKIVEVIIHNSGDAVVNDFCGIAFRMSKCYPQSEAGFDEIFAYYVSVAEFTEWVLAAQEVWINQPTFH
jgi:hypothetical protein